MDLTAPGLIEITLFETTYECEARFSTYASDPDVIAITLWGEDPEFGFPEEITKVTVNLSETLRKPGPHCIFVPDYGSTEGLFKQLEAMGLLKYIRDVQIGYGGGVEAELRGIWRAYGERALEARMAQDLRR